MPGKTKIIRWLTIMSAFLLTLCLAGIFGGNYRKTEAQRMSFAQELRVVWWDDDVSNSLMLIRWLCLQRA